jgi:hypothetical protein
MEQQAEKRVQYRRYEDRRVALKLAIHEALFDDPPGAPRDELILEKIRENYAADRTAFVEPTGDDTLRIAAETAEEDQGSITEPIAGAGVAALSVLLAEAPGALTLTRVKRPAVFPVDAWESLWGESLAGLGTALLCVRLPSERAPARILWILQSHYSREWSSRDRDLAEEVASLLGRARDKEA